MANLMEMIENLPIELQEEIYKRKHELEMKDVCEEIQEVAKDWHNNEGCVDMTNLYQAFLNLTLSSFHKSGTSFINYLISISYV